MVRSMKWMSMPALVAMAMLAGCGDSSNPSPTGGNKPTVAAPKADAVKAATDNAKKDADAAKTSAAATADKAAKDAGSAAKEAGAAAKDAAAKAPAMAEGHGKAAAAMTVGTLAEDAPKPTNTVCPVGGEPVSPTDPKAAVAIHDGKAYAMCCADCVAPFMKDPAKYLAKLEAK